MGESGRQGEKEGGESFARKGKEQCCLDGWAKVEEEENSRPMQEGNFQDHV